MHLRSLALAAGFILAGTIAGHASVPTAAPEAGVAPFAGATMATSAADPDKSTVVARRGRGSDDPPGDDRGRRGRGKDDKNDDHRGRDRGRGSDDGPNHT